jgi:hypothetical protein
MTIISGKYQNRQEILSLLDVDDLPNQTYKNIQEFRENV